MTDLSQIVLGALEFIMVWKWAMRRWPWQADRDSYTTYQVAVRVGWRLLAFHVSLMITIVALTMILLEVKS